MLGRRRLHRIAYTSSSLTVAREVVLRKAFAWLANLSFLVATFKARNPQFFFLIFIFVSITKTVVFTHFL